ncbi:hypothetical protein JQ557_09115 [Bradyrhizobium sp. U87765 SZCCT0131]|uniref:hypothetical protein n=1 Tax=unclassified Bradyrhizobium TaxID=2631580 RepID=UPI001BA5F135|nr:MULTISPECIES: hypothetical protein [unclassified Bradyrhizobium]MBR1218144.1 hypothetical protein [Bradyrhizobium sp. U87765 SZCCT0131]MBR1260910.1 hypothetical protein [Bradyrhizobium sp. U87765 SZCCT0134]MBR1303642.1 hypothetical protein [Bradyrhizobium sp. U87765 SZCCT0110]MBR1319248.1 hypothetical protein [Bradyrhizobium sp. U87765 SZCCT0109]MBR1347573.1 hypothetical protein [Bradyrhizobium sp. U87765 SZCCT0048]
MTPMRRGRQPRVTHELIAAQRTRAQALRVVAYRQAGRRLRDILAWVTGLGFTKLKL